MYYSTVLWDWNGTILNDLHLCHTIFQVLAEKYSFMSYSLQEYRDKFRFPLTSFYSEAGFSGDFDELARDFRKLYEDGFCECTLQDGSLEFVKLLHEHGVEQHVISAHNNHDLELMVKGFGLTNYFTSINGLDGIKGGCKIELAKVVKQRHGLPCDHTLFIGDTLHDYDVARSIGTDSWLIAQGHVSHDRLAQCDTARTFHSLMGVTSQFEHDAA